MQTTTPLVVKEGMVEGIEGWLGDCVVEDVRLGCGRKQRRDGELETVGQSFYRRGEDQG